MLDGKIISNSTFIDGEGELIEEDIALCEFVDVSKNELQKLLRKGLNLLMED